MDESAERAQLIAGAQHLVFVPRADGDCCPFSGQLLRDGPAQSF
jgi:hypothetical protein